MYQIITEFENIGPIPIHQLYICSNQTKLVSISEEFAGKWKLCETKLFSFSLSNFSDEETIILFQKVEAINSKQPSINGNKFRLIL